MSATEGGVCAHISSNAIVASGSVQPKPGMNTGCPASRPFGAYTWIRAFAAGVISPVSSFTTVSCEDSLCSNPHCCTNARTAASVAVSVVRFIMPFVIPPKSSRKNSAPWSRRASRSFRFFGL